MASSLKILKFQQLARAKGVPDNQINSFIQQGMSQSQGNVMGATQKTQQPQPRVQAQNQQAITTQPQGNFLTKFVGALVEPAVNYGKMVAGAGYEAYRAGKAKATGNDSVYLNKNPFLTDQELETFSDPIKGSLEGAKRTAGAMSYAVPAGKTIKGAAALAGASGALDAVSREGATPESVLQSTITSGLVGGALGTGAKVLNAIKPQKVGDTLQKAGEAIKIQTYVKQMGVKPISREGGNKLLEKMNKIGITPGNAENVLEQSKKIIQENSGEIFRATQQLDQKGVKITIKEVLADLQKQLKNAKSVTTKKPIQEVIDTIMQDFGKTKSLTPSDIYLLKAEYGPLGSWNSLSSTIDKTKAEVWRDVYTKMNQVLDDTLQKNGFSEFRAINDAVHTAIQASQYAQRVGNIAPNRATFGLTDFIASAGGFAGGGIPGMAAVYTGKKVLEAGKVNDGVGNIIKEAGKTISQLPSSNLPLGSMATNAVVKTAASQSFVGAEETLPNNGTNTNYYNESNKGEKLANTIGSEIPADHPYSIPQEFNNISKTTPSPMNPFGNLNKRQVMALALANGANVSEVKEVAELYDMLASDTETITQETMKVAGDMRAEYFKRSTENGFLPATNAYKKILNTSDSAAGDLSLIYGYMKILDPSSVVRETEASMAQEAGSFGDQVQNAVGKVLSGQRLSPQQREQFKAEATNVYQTYQESQDQIDQLYYGLSQRYGLDPALVGIGSIGQ